MTQGTRTALVAALVMLGALLPGAAFGTVGADDFHVDVENWVADRTDFLPHQFRG